MFSNNQVNDLIVRYMRNMEQFLNVIELELKKPEPNLNIVATAAGKLTQIYSFITEMAGTFSGRDYRVGGFRESVWDIKNVLNPELEEILEMEEKQGDIKK